jgi:hypothetical protein
MSQRSKDLETEAARQSHYIAWCSIMSIPDPCGIEYGYQRIVAIWVKYIMVGINYYNKDVLRSNTVRGYALAVNTLFRLRGYKPPTDMTDRNNMPGIVINNLIKQEDIASQRAPLDEAIFAEAHRAAKASHSLDSDRHLMFDILTLARYIGPRVSEYAQTNQERVDYHVYPNGTSVIKAFTANDFVFCDDKNNILSFIDESSLTLAAFVRITWRIQKNRQNNQTIQLKADPKNPDICPVRGAIRMVTRARRLSQPDDMPLACYRTRKAPLLYLTGTRIATLLREAVRKVRPSTPSAELKRYSAHSLRVWACVLLDEAGKSASFIQKRLRWMGDSFKMYLRDTNAIQSKHVDALQASSAEVMKLITTPPADVVRLVATMSEITVEDENHLDEMD